MSKPTKPAKPRRKISITLSPGIRLYSEEYFLEALSPVGLSRTGFRKLCAALSVPVLSIGSHRLVDSFAFGLAVRSICRIGEPDFLAPGSAPLRRGRRPRHSTTSLDTARLRTNLTYIVTELLLANRDLSKTLAKHSDLEIARASRAAAIRMTEAGLQLLPLRAQEDATATLLSRIERDRIM